MPSATYRVLLRERPRYADARGEWRLLLRSTRDDVVSTRNYSAFVDAARRPDLDARCVGLTLAFEPGLRLLVEMAWGPRRHGVGAETRPAQWVSALLVLPPGDDAISDDDIFAIWAEWRSLLSRYPDLPAAEGAATIADILSGVVDGVTATFVETLINHNHAPS